VRLVRLDSCSTTGPGLYILVFVWHEVSWSKIECHRQPPVTINALYGRPGVGAVVPLASGHRIQRAFLRGHLQICWDLNFYKFY